MNFSKYKIIAVICLVLLVSASCDLFGPAVARGVIKTTNGGADWQFANSIKGSKTASLVGDNISSLAFDFSNPEHLFAGTFNDGLYRSENSGEAWERILSRFSVLDIAVNPYNAQVIYVAGFFDLHGRVLKTSDGGKSWVEIFNEASQNNPVRTLAVNPQSPDEVVIGLGSGDVVKSTDGGSSWRLLESFTDTTSKIRWTTSGIYVVMRSKGVFKSSDGGATFQEITKSLQTINNFVGISISTAIVQNFYQISVSNFNPQLIYITTDGGLFKTTDSGSRWTFIGLPQKKKEVPATAVAIAPQTDNVVYVSAASVIYKSTDGGFHWQTQDSHTNGTINTLLINPQLPQIVFAGIFSQ